METLHGHTEELPQNSPSDLDAKGQENPANNYKIMAQIEELESKFDHNPDGSEKWQRFVGGPVEDQYRQRWMIWKILALRHLFRKIDIKYIRYPRMKMSSDMLS